MAAPVFVAFESVNGEARMLEHDALKLTDAERTVEVTPVNYAYPPGDVRRYGADPSGADDSTSAFQDATDSGHPVYIPQGEYLVSNVTYTGRVIWVGEGPATIIRSDGMVLDVTSGTGSFIDNLYLENITAPWIITRDPSNWTGSVAGTLQQSNDAGYQPTINDADIWGSLTSPQQNQQIGPVIQFSGAASGIRVSRIYGRFVRINIGDAVDSIVRDCDIRGGKGAVGAISFDNWTNGVQRGVRNAAINNRVSYPSFCGVFFSANDDFQCIGNTIYLGGESGLKTLQAGGVTFNSSVGGATSGTLSGAITNGSYTFVFSNAEVRTVTVTGGTSASWSSALSAGTVLTASTYQSTLNPQCLRGQITGNQCTQMYFDGIDSLSTFGSTVDAAQPLHKVHDNYCYGNFGNGINGDGQFNSYHNNRLILNSRYGIWLTTSNCSIKDNVCYDNNQERSSTAHDIGVGDTGQIANHIDGNLVWAGSGQNNYGIYGPGTNNIGENWGVGSSFFFGNPGAISSIVQNYADAATGNLTDQSFLLVIRNNGGTLQHAFFSDLNETTLGTHSSRVPSASVTFGTTPTATDSSTAFATGGKISSANTERFICDTAVQSSTYVDMVASIALNTTGTALNVAAVFQTNNVNGVTRMRLAFMFTNATSGATVALNTTNIPSGTRITVQFKGKLA